MNKEMFLEEHERLIEEYMEANPGVTWDQAYRRTGDSVCDAVSERYADMCDRAHDEYKDSLMEDKK